MHSHLRLLVRHVFVSLHIQKSGHVPLLGIWLRRRVLATPIANAVPVQLPATACLAGAATVCQFWLFWRNSESVSLHRHTAVSVRLERLCTAFLDRHNGGMVTSVDCVTMLNI